MTIAPHNTNGEPYLTPADIGPGTKVTLDDGFGCVEPGVHEIKQNEDGVLYFDCSSGPDGQHAIVSQLERNGDHEFYVGITKAPEAAE